MVHQVYVDDDDDTTVSSVPRQPVASTSKAVLPPPPRDPSSPTHEGEAPVFKRKRDRNPFASEGSTFSDAGSFPAHPVAIIGRAGLSLNLATGKRIKTFHAESDDDSEQQATNNQHLKNGNSTKSRTQSRKDGQAERKERADLLLQGRMRLPVWYARQRILEEIEKRDTVVVLGETGSGKTTRKLTYTFRPKKANFS